MSQNYIYLPIMYIFIGAVMAISLVTLRTMTSKASVFLLALWAPAGTWTRFYAAGTWNDHNRGRRLLKRLKSFAAYFSGAGMDTSKKSQQLQSNWALNVTYGMLNWPQISIKTSKHNEQWWSPTHWRVSSPTVRKKQQGFFTQPLLAIGCQGTMPGKVI